MSISPELQSRIQGIVDSGSAVLFMKGDPAAPKCGFSAQVVQVLNRLLPEYRTFDVLSDSEVREGVKEFSDWPTIPQLYVGGEFMGGCDIVKEMYDSGELHDALGMERPALTGDQVAISISAEAEQILRDAQQQQTGRAPLRHRRQVPTLPRLRAGGGIGGSRPGWRSDLPARPGQCRAGAGRIDHRRPE